MIAFAWIALAFSPATADAWRVEFARLVAAEDWAGAEAAARVGLPAFSGHSFWVAPQFQADWTAYKRGSALANWRPQPDGLSYWRSDSSREAALGVRLGSSRQPEWLVLTSDRVRWFCPRPSCQVLLLTADHPSGLTIKAHPPLDADGPAQSLGLRLPDLPALPDGIASWTVRAPLQTGGWSSHTFDVSFLAAVPNASVTPTASSSKSDPDR